LEAIRDNNLHLYVHTFNRIPDLLFTHKGQTYARYITYFSVFTANLEISHPGENELLKLETFSVARSFITSSCTDVDKTMEEMFMRNAKLRGSSGSGVVAC